MQRIALSVVAAMAAVGAVLLIYWCGGGDFVRGKSLGAIAFLAIGFGVITAGMVYTFPSGEGR